MIGSSHIGRYPVEYCKCGEFHCSALELPPILDRAMNVSQSGKNEEMISRNWR